MSQCQGKKLTSPSFLRYVQPEILTNIFGAFTNDHPIGLKSTSYFWWFLMNIPPYPSFRRENQTYPSAQGHCALQQLGFNPSNEMRKERDFYHQT